MSLVINIAGVLGIGKTTLIKRLTAEEGGPLAGWLVVHERNDANPLWEAYNHDRKRYCYAFQTSMLQTRCEDYAAALATGRPMLLDCSMMGDRLYAVMQHEQGIMSDGDFAAYEREYAQQTASLATPRSSSICAARPRPPLRACRSATAPPSAASR